MALVQNEKDQFPARLSARCNLNEEVNRIVGFLSVRNTQRFRESCFGQFMDVQKLKFQGQLYLHLLFRQDKSMSLDKITFHFNNKEADFGVTEFSLITGLGFGSKSTIPSSSGIFKKCFRRFNPLCLIHVENALEEWSKKEKGDGDMTLKLALLCFLYGVLLVRDRKTKKIVEEYIHLVDDLEAFNAYPWGRVAFDFLVKETRACMAGRVKGFWERKETKEKHDFENFDIHGFHPALQVWAYEAVPAVAKLCAITTKASKNRVPRILRWSTEATVFTFDKLKTTIFRTLLPGDDDTLVVHKHLKPSKLEQDTESLQKLIVWEDALEKEDLRQKNEEEKKKKSLKRKMFEEKKEGEGNDQDGGPNPPTDWFGLSRKVDKIESMLKSIMEHLGCSIAEEVGKEQAPSSAHRSADDGADSCADKDGDRDAARVAQHDDDRDLPADIVADLPAEIVADKPADIVADKPVDIVAEEPADIPAHVVADKPSSPSDVSSKGIPGPVCDETTSDEKKDTPGPFALVPAGSDAQPITYVPHKGFEKLIAKPSKLDALLSVVQTTEVVASNPTITEDGASESDGDNAKPDFVDIGSPVRFGSPKLGDVVYQKRKRTIKPGPTKKSPFTDPSHHVPPRKKGKVVVEDAPEIPQLQLFDPMGLYPQALIEEFEKWFDENKDNKDVVVHCSVEEGHKFCASWFLNIRDTEGWLDDQQMDLLMRLVAYKSKKWPERFLSNWTTVDMLFWNNLTIKWGAKFVKALKNKKKLWSWWKEDETMLEYLMGTYPIDGVGKSWADVEKVYGIGHVTGNHWVVYELDLNKKLIVVYDSMSESKSFNTYIGQFRKLALMLPSLCEEAHIWDNRVEPTQKDWNIERYEHPPQQLNTSDCGIMCMKIVESLVTGCGVVKINPKRCDEFRLRICSELYKEGNIRC